MSHFCKMFWHLWRKSATREYPATKRLQQELRAALAVRIRIYFFFSFAEPLGLLWQEVLPCPSAFYKNKLLVLLTHRCFSISYSVCIWPASCLFVSYICFLQTKPVLFLLYFLVEGCNVFELFVINFWDSVTFVNQEGFFFWGLQEELIICILFALKRLWLNLGFPR